MSTLSNAEISRYKEEGVLVVRSLIQQGDLGHYRAAVRRLIEDTASTGHPYEKVLRQMHLPWRVDEVLAELTRSSAIAAVAQALSGLKDMRVFLDQVIDKEPGGAPTIAHQDAPFLSFTDRNSLNAWVALDHTSAENGALSYFIGSHRLGRLELVHLDGEDDLVRSHSELEGLELRQIEAEPGDVIFHNCLTVHQATANSTARRRMAYGIQYMAGDSRYNGVEHLFLKEYRLARGDILGDLDCFASPVLKVT